MAMASRAGGGQESVALMNNYLARVKDECKPAIYGAFIGLMNAYHGNMLAVDAFLDELYVLFSPRVHLLEDVKPLVDESYHHRVDELCDKVRSGGGAGGGSAENTYSLPAALGAFASSSQHTTTNSYSSNNSSVLTSSAVSSPRGGGGIKAEARSTTPLHGGSGNASEAALAAPAATVAATARNCTSPPLLPLKAAAAGGGGRGLSGGGSGRTSGTNDELEGALSLSSPSTRGLSTELGDASDIAGLLTGIEEPSVESALLDFMMCDDDNDNPSALGSSVSPFEPPPISNQQQIPQRQHQWSADPLTATSNGKTPTTTSPTNKSRVSADSPSSASSSAERTVAASLINTSTTNNSGSSTTSLLWSRRESAPNLADLPCRIHATPIAGCRNCRWEASLSSSAPAAAPSAPRRRCTVAISNGASKQHATGGSSLPRGVSRTNGSIGVHGGGGGKNDNNLLDMDDGTYHGPGKRVWEKSQTGGAGSSGGGGLSTPGSCSTPPTSFYFPSAAAATAAAASSASVTAPGDHGGATPSRPNARRKISTDPLPTFIKDEGSSSTAAGGGGGGRRDSTPPSVGGGGSRFGGNSGGGSGSGRINSSPLVNLDPDSIGAKSSGFVGMGSARSLSTMGEGSSNGDGGGSEGGGRPSSGDQLEKLVVSVATRGMQQALTYGLRNTFFMLLRKQDQEIAELKEEGLRWSANDTRLREINQQLLNDNMQLRAAAAAPGSGGGGAGGGDGSEGWDSHSRGPSPNTS